MHISNIKTHTMSAIQVLFVATLLILPTFSMEKSSPYQLPEFVSPKNLTQSSVIIRSCSNIGTGFALGTKHIITAAHVVVGHNLPNEKIECMALRSVEKSYDVPTVKAFLAGDEQMTYAPIFALADSLRSLDIVGVHFPETTQIVTSNEAEQPVNLSGLIAKFKECMTYGLVDAIKYCSNGVSGEARTTDNDGINTSHNFRVFGPDVAILECREPHGLPSLEIAEPVDERSPLHIVGLSGKRYITNNSSDLTNIDGGAPLLVNKEVRFVFKPAIYTQQFKCLPADKVGNYEWMNRVFLKVIGNKFFINDQVLPNSPKGFGLIAEDDSGSAAIIVRNGQIYLAGIASAGQVESSFSVTQNFLESKGFNPQVLKEFNHGLELLSLYNDALAANKQTTTEANRDKKLFVTQALADLTHLRAWILTVINK